MESEKPKPQSVDGVVIVILVTCALFVFTGMVLNGTKSKDRRVAPTRELTPEEERRQAREDRHNYNLEHYGKD